MRLVKQSKFIVSVLLAVIVLISAISPLSSMLVNANEYVHPDNMLYFKGKNTGPLMTRINLISGAAYNVYFGLTNNVTAFDIVCKTDENRNDIGINEALVSKENKGKYTLYKYTFVYPSSKNTGLAFIGLNFDSNCEGYVFDIKLALGEDETQKQLIGNGNFSSGLDHWAWDWDAWFETWGAGSGKTEWSNQNVELITKPFDESLFTLEPPVAENDRMLYFKSKNVGPLMERVNFKSGAQYNISFGLSNNLTTFDIVGKTDGSRNNIGISETLVSKEDKGKYTLYNYTFTFPSSKPDGLAFIGFSFPSNSEGYIFNIKMTRVGDDTAKELISNGDFKSGLDRWAWDWDAWFETWGNGFGKTEWSNQNVQLVVMDFDESKFDYEPPAPPEPPKDKMLYFNSKNNGPLIYRVNFKSATDYKISFGVSNNLTDFDIVGKTDGDRNGISITETLISKEDKGAYTLYEYSFTFPSNQSDGLAFIGFNFPASKEGYIFNVKLWLADDTAENQLISNGNFQSGLNHWAWDWDAWFETWGAGSGKTEWSNKNVQLNVMDFDESKFTIPVPEPPKDQMLYFNSKNIGPLMYRVDLKSGASYNISFGVSNNLTEFDIVGKTDYDRKGISIDEKLVNKEIKEKYTLYKYSFTFPSNQPDGLAFIGFAFTLSKEGYIFDIKLSRADDETEKQLIGNGDFMSGLNNWAWDWDAWFVDYPGWQGKGLTEWSNSDVQLNIMDFDENKFTIPIPEPPKDKMLYYKNKNAGPLMTRVNLVPGQKYYFSYYVSKNAVGTKVVALTDGDRKNISISAKQLVNKSTGRHTFCKWEFTVPQTLKVDDGQSATLAFLGVKFILGYDGYFYNAKLVKADDAAEKQLMPNGDFRSGLDNWAWDWDAWFVNYPGWQGKGLTKWNNDNVTLNVTDLDESKFSVKIPDVPISDHRMLQFKNGANVTPFVARVNVTPGQTFIMSYSIFCTDETSLSVLTDGDRYTLKVNEKLIEKTEHKQYTTYTYKFTIPKTVNDNLVFVGVEIPYYAEGYIFDMSCYSADDPQKKQVWQNPGFMSDLDFWTWGWHGWFGMGTSEGSYLKPKGINHWTNGIDEIKVMDFNVDKISDLIADINRDDGVWWSSKDYKETGFSNLESDSGKASVSGVFLTADGVPLVNVKMILKSDTHTYASLTNRYGKFFFNSVAVGNYELLFVNSSGERISTGFFDTLEDADKLSVSLTSTVSEFEEFDDEEETVEYFDGYVYTPKLVIVPDIKIYLEDFGEVTTDEKGHFEFTNVPAGDYELYTVLPNGKKYVFRTVSLQKDLKLSVKLKYDVGSAPEKTQDSSQSNNYIIIFSVVGGVILLLGSAAVLFIVLKKRRKVQ